tara:strand:- start:1161 stop:1481 length:321 start_codon:yes stop_codon:yes gene_type:complete
MPYGDDFLDSIGNILDRDTSREIKIKCSKCHKVWSEASSSKDWTQEAWKTDGWFKVCDACQKAQLIKGEGYKMNPELSSDRFLELASDGTLRRKNRDDVAPGGYLE